MAATTSKPKYVRLARQLREQIHSGELAVGDRLPSYSEMRAQFGASTATMQRVFDVLSQEQLIERRHSSGIYVAEPKRVLTDNIGVIVSSGFRAQREPFYAHLNHGVQQAATRHRRRLMLLETAPGWNAADLIGSVDGLLLSGHPAQANQEIVRLKPASMPCVSLFVIGEEMSSVVADEYGAAKNAVAYLQELGHRRIACLMAKVERNTHAQRGRFEGYSDALPHAGSTPTARWARLAEMPSHQLSLDWGREQMRAWLQSDWHQLNCTALLVQNDQAAIGAMQGCREAGMRVPNDLSVMGFDGTELCDHATPRLTSMQMPLEQMGAKAVELLIAQIENNRVEEQTIVLPAKLRVGESVAPQ